MGDRDALLDVLKGFGIVLVVFAHTCKGEASAVVYLFHMPLFFVLSGCALAYSKRRDSVGVRGYLRSLVVPYLAFSLITFAYWCGIEWKLRPSAIPALFEGELGGLDIRMQEFMNIFSAYSVKGAFEYNVVMWFLPCLFCSLVLYKCLRLYTGRYLAVSVWGLAAISFILADFMPALPWCFEIALVALPFVWIGDKVPRHIVVGGDFGHFDNRATYGNCAAACGYENA